MVIDSIGHVFIGSDATLSAFNSNNPPELTVDYDTTTSNTIAYFKGFINSYLQINLRNRSNGSNASTDYVATADNGTDTTNYVDMGINSSTFAPSVENWGGPNDAYLYSSSRNLIMGTQSSGSDVIFLIGGGKIKSNAIMRLNVSDGHVIIGKGEGTTTPIGTTVRGPNAQLGSTNIAGGSLKLSGGSSTGNATGGILNITGGAATSSGTGGTVNISGGTSASGTGGPITFNTGNAEKMRIDALGNVGIGTASPSSALSVLSASNPLYLSGVQATASFTTDSVLTILNGIVKKTPYSSLPGGGSGWGLTGNSATNTGTNFLGTTDGNGLVFKVNNTQAGYLGLSGSSYATSIGVGSSGSSTAFQSTAIGAGAQATGANSSLAVGYNATAATQNAIAIGTSSLANTNSEAIAIGYNSKASAFEGIALGVNSTASTNNQTIAIGYGTTASGFQGVALGYGASATTNNSALAVGVSATASGYQATAIGNGASATAQNSTAIGNGTTTITANTLILGNGANVGIGTSVPSNKLSILASSNPLYLSGVQATATFNTDSVLTINAGVVKKSAYSSFTGNFWTTTGNGGTSTSTNFIGTTDAVDFVAKTNNTERMRITSAGNVGIGTTVPANALQVVGTNPLNLQGVQSGSYSTDSILVIINGVVKKISPLIFYTSKAQYNVTIPVNISNNSGLTVLVPVANTSYTLSGPNPTVIVNPEIDLPDGLIIAWARVSAINVVSINFRNVTNQSVAAQTIKFDISIQH